MSSPSWYLTPSNISWRDKTYMWSPIRTINSLFFNYKLNPISGLASLNGSHTLNLIGLLCLPRWEPHWVFFMSQPFMVPPWVGLRPGLILGLWALLCDPVYSARVKSVSCRVSSLSLGFLLVSSYLNPKNGQPIELSNSRPGQIFSQVITVGNIPNISPDYLEFIHRKVLK